MINKKVFALTLVASSVIAAGCSSDDDGDDEADFDQTSDAVATDAQSVDVTGDGILTDDDDFNGDGFIDNTDVERFAAVMADENSTDVNGDGGIDGNDDIDRDGDIDDDDIAAFGGGTTPDPEPMVIGENSITALVRGSEDFSTLSTAVDAAGLDGTLGSEDGTFTVFAPNDDAFAAFQAANPGVVEGFLANPDDGNLANVLTYHVLPTRETVDSLRELVIAAGDEDDDDIDDDDDLLNNTATVTSVQGDELTLGVVDNDGDDTVLGDLALTVNGLVVVGEDVTPSNGNVLVLNGGLLVPTTPPATMTDPDPDPVDPNAPVANTGPVEGTLAGLANYSEFLEVFRSTLGGPSLDDPNNTWTVIAPTNDALEDDIDIQDYVVVGTKFEPDAFAGDIAANSGETFSVSGSGTGGDLQIDGNDARVIAESDTLIVYGVDGTLED